MKMNTYKDLWKDTLKNRKLAISLAISRLDNVERELEPMNIFRAGRFKWKIDSHDGFRWNYPQTELSANQYGRLCEIGLLVFMFNIKAKELENWRK
jgi:hypothetical protein